MSIAQRGINKLFNVFPSVGWRFLASRFSPLRLDQLFVVFSYDCDTAEDAPAAQKLFLQLKEMGIQPSFAVPGEQLEQSPDLYRTIAAQGGTFLNHGYRAHTRREGDGYRSVNYYHELTPAQIEEDIQRGHETIKRVIGKAPVGFRTPHFGAFQDKRQLQFIHNFLNRLGYTYSTSTSPFQLLGQRLPWKIGNIQEFPVCGSYAYPLTVFDSWTYARPGQPRSYERLLEQTLEHLQAQGFRGYLNLYGDPSHLAGSAAYARTLSYIQRQKIPSLTYEQLISLQIK